MDAKYYTPSELKFNVNWSEEDNEYVATCNQFPSLSWLDKTPEAALKKIREIVSIIIHEMGNGCKLKC